MAEERTREEKDQEFWAGISGPKRVEADLSYLLTAESIKKQREEEEKKNKK